jgi:hypothetical protein
VLQGHIAIDGTVFPKSTMAAQLAKRSGRTGFIIWLVSVFILFYEIDDSNSY